MNYKLVLTILISLIFLIAALNYTDHLSAYGLIVSILIMANIVLIVLIKIYNGRGFYCDDLSLKSSKEFSIDKQLQEETLNYVNNL